MALSQSVTATVAVTGCGVAVVALLVALLAVTRASRLRRPLRAALGDGASPDLLGAVAEHVAAVEALRRDVVGAREELRGVRLDLADAVRHVALVRYDAFGDMGGRLSWSVALLDDAGDGVVLTSINGRQETRGYAKAILASASEQTLSPEEAQAVTEAMGAGQRRRPAGGRHAAAPAPAAYDDRSARPWAADGAAASEAAGADEEPDVTVQARR